jgi:uncharacterized protein (DUF488 family)
MPVWTVGHGTLAAEQFVSLLRGADLKHLVDIRSYPASRHNPQHARQPLERSLTDAGIAYAWEQRLGGRRRPDPASPNVALRHEAFRAYADHMRTREFRAGCDELVERAERKAVAVMCAESVWWRCHRRLLADALVLLRNVEVVHLFHDGRSIPHSPTPEARVLDGEVRYDLGATTPLL